MCLSAHCLPLSPLLDTSHHRGAAWLLNRYAHVIPDDILHAMRDGSHHSHVYPARRELLSQEDGTLVYEDTGVFTHAAGSYHYLPTSRTKQSPGLLGSLAKLVSPVTISRYIRDPRVPEAHTLPLWNLMVAIMNADTGEAAQASFLTELVQTHRGTQADASEISEGRFIDQPLDETLRVKIDLGAMRDPDAQVSFGQKVFALMWPALIGAVVAGATWLLQDEGSSFAWWWPAIASAVALLGSYKLITDPYAMENVRDV